MMFNSSRGVIYASAASDFADAARQAARETQQQINQAADISDDKQL